MASRFQQQPQKDGAIMGKNQKPPPGEGNKNRRVLGDIGNTVNVRAIAEGKQPLPQVSRPVTRSFRAQLLRNAELAAQVANKKTAQPAPIEKEKEEDAKVKCPKKITTKPKEVIIINSSSPVSSRKPPKAKAFTSVLSARSKVASEIYNKPTSPVHDIDGKDVNDQIAMVEYVEDLYSFYKAAENVNMPRNNYMDDQVEITPKMRAILIDWLIEVIHKFNLTDETLYLTIYIIDKYLSIAIVKRRELQLVGISAMLISSKYEEIWAPEVGNFIAISDSTYCREQILSMEKTILEKLEWDVTVPTPYVFLLRFLKAALADQEMEHMTYFLAELGMMNYSILAFKPSMLAASAVYVARRTLGRKPHWDPTLKKHTGFEETELQECAKLLVSFHSSMAESKLKVVCRKYSGSKLHGVSLKPPVDIKAFEAV